MTETITLVDHGRGLQLSTSRITVMDLVQYFRAGCDAAEVRRWIPSLSDDEIAVAEAHYRANRAELDAADDRVRARREEQIREQHLRFPPPDGSPAERLARMRERLHLLRAESAGDGTPR